MEIKLVEITIGELTKGYTDNKEAGVIGYSGKLDIRPPYQREFIYDEDKRNAVIDTIEKDFPLNVMYWATRETDADVPYEVLDGQQRTISICQYVTGDFAHNFRYFDNLTQTEKDKILNYKLMVYICSGNDREKLDWFRTINIAGEKLFDQELLNAVYAGPFVSDAKKYFSKNNCPAYNIGKELINAKLNRQGFLEIALKWKAQSESHFNYIQTIEGYMALHQHDPNAIQLWQYYNSVITWVEATFNVAKRKNIMKGLNWGELYDKYHNNVYDIEALDNEIHHLIIDSEVENKKGICRYVLNHDEHELGLRSFPDDIKLEVWEKQNHHCANPNCPDKDKEFDFNEMEGDHITPWRDGGKTRIENCQMLCRDCNRRKGTK